MKFFSTCLLLAVSFLFSCSSEKDDMKASLTGNWLILYPDHHLRTRSEREVYGRYQDSMVNLFGLKLISFNAEGKFMEIDSLFQIRGQWTLLNEKELQLREGGKGFNPFNTTIDRLENDTLRLVQQLPLENEKIKVVWHLKKVDEDTVAQKLLAPQANEWRKKPGRPETEPEIRKRLVGLLNYYSNYLKLVSKESSYFLKSRIHLPFQYYQHALGMKKEMSPGFIHLFYDENDARKAYTILSQTVDRLAGQFEWGENFVVEYALFFKRMIYYI
jgi:hypothetical protein